MKIGTKIYVLTSGCYDELNVEFATLDKKKAQLAAKRHDWDIQEHADDDSWIPFNHEIALNKEGVIVVDDKLTNGTRQQYCRWLIGEHVESHLIGGIEQKWTVPYHAYHARGKTRQEALKLAKEGIKTNTEFPALRAPYPTPEPLRFGMIDASCNLFKAVSCSATITGPSLPYPMTIRKALQIGDTCPEGVVLCIDNKYEEVCTITVVKFQKFNVI